MGVLLGAGFLVLVGVSLLLAACGTVNEGPESRPTGAVVLSDAELQAALHGPVDFKRHVKPILETRCLYCHCQQEMPGKFSLETKFEAMKDGRIVPGKADESLLIITLTTGNHGLTMPAVGTAPPEKEITILSRWIDQGAKWPAGLRLRPRG